MIKYIVLYYYCSMSISLPGICFHFNTTNFLRNKLFRNRLPQNESFYRWLCLSNSIIPPLVVSFQQNYSTTSLYDICKWIDQLRTFPFTQHLLQMLRNSSCNDSISTYSFTRKVLAIRSVSAKRLVLIVDKTGQNFYSGTWVNHVVGLPLSIKIVKIHVM